MARLNKKFFEQNTLKVARELLGKILARKLPAGKNGQSKIIRGIVTETEAYKGISDRASHASRGVTPRNAIMFGQAGRAYVYLIYGMHHCLNIVTERNGYPAAVLIRSVVLTGELPAIDTHKSHLWVRGPGRVCKFFHIDKTLNGEDITKSKKLWIENTPLNLKI